MNDFNKPKRPRFATSDRFILGCAFVVLVAALVVLMRLPMHFRPSQANQTVGTLTTPSKVRRLGLRETSWVEIQKGAIHPGDFVATNEKSGAVIQFSNGSSVTLDPSSIVEIVGLTENQYEVVIHRGKLASSPGLNVRQSDHFDLATLPNASRTQLAMPGGPLMEVPLPK